MGVGHSRVFLNPIRGEGGRAMESNMSKNNDATLERHLCFAKVVKVCETAWNANVNVR